MEKQYTPHPRIEERAKYGPHTIKDEHVGLNGRIAISITNFVGTMWCAYLFAALALLGLPTAIEGGRYEFISWFVQTFLQLILISIILFGQKVAARASDKQAMQTYKDTEAALQMQDEIHRLMKANNEMTEEIRNAIKK